MSNEPEVETMTHEPPYRDEGYTVVARVINGVDSKQGLEQHPRRPSIAIL